MAFFTRLKNGQGSPVFSCGLSLLAVGSVGTGAGRLACRWIYGPSRWLHSSRSNLILRPIPRRFLVALAGRIALLRWVAPPQWSKRLFSIRLIRLASPPRLAMRRCDAGRSWWGSIPNFGVASGADAYGYISQADLWIKGQLTVPQEWVAPAPWPEAIWTSTPLGYGPAVTGAAIVLYVRARTSSADGRRQTRRRSKCAVAWVGTPAAVGWCG